MKLKKIINLKRIYNGVDYIRYYTAELITEGKKNILAQIAIEQNAMGEYDISASLINKQDSELETTFLNEVKNKLNNYEFDEIDKKYYQKSL